jgi:hypothetical protein
MITRRYLRALSPESTCSANLTATVSLSNGTLRLLVATQPQYELVPKWGSSFDAKGLPSLSVEFKKDPSGGDGRRLQSAKWCVRGQAEVAVKRGSYR